MKKAKWILFIILTGITVFLYINRQYITFQPWVKIKTLDWIGSASGNGKAAAIIADASKSVTVVANDGEMLYKIYAGSNASRSFVSAELTELDYENNLYVLDKNFAGFLNESSERILKYSSNGTFLSVIYNHEYLNEDFIITKGKISGMASDGDVLYLVRLSHEGFFLESVDTANNNKAEVINFFPYPNAFRDFSYCRLNVKNQTLVWTTKSGNILQYSFSGLLMREIKADDNFSPYMTLSDDNDNFIYTDILQDIIGLIDNKTGERKILFSSPVSDGYFYYYIQYFNGNIYASYGAEDILIINGNGEYSSIDSYFLNKNDLLFTYILFCLCIIDVLLFLLLLVWGIKFLLKQKASAIVRQIMLVGFCVIFGAGISSVIIIKELHSQTTENIFGELEKISKIMASSIDIDIISRVKSPRDFDSGEFRSFTENIYSICSNLDFDGKQFYIMIWQKRGDEIYIMYDLEYCTGTLYPFGKYEDSYVEMVYNSKSYERIKESLSSGTWEYVIGPIFDKDGNPVAAIETGYNIQSVEEKNRTMIIQIALIVLASTVAFLLIVIECLSMFDAFNKRKKLHSGDNIIEVKQNALKNAITYLLNSYKKEFNKEGHIKIASRSYGAVINRLYTTYKTGLSSDFQPELLRAAAFFMYFSMNFASAILPLYSAELYIPLFNIPREFFITLPFVALSSFIVISLIIVPRLLAVTGVKRISYISAVIILAGNILCILADNIISLSLGYALIGLSCGAFSLIFNTIIGSQKNASDVNSGFAHLSASYISGLNAGVVCGAMIAQFFPYRLLFVFSALIAFLFLIMIVYSLRSNIFSSLYESTGMVTRLRKVTMVKDLIKNKNNENLTLIKFIFKPVVLCILFLAFVPYVISMNFSEYFMPVFAIENGLGEANIGQLMLLSGLFAILFSASLCRLMAKKVPVLLSVILPLLLNAAALFLFSLNVSVIMLIITIILLAIVNIFAFANIQTYFTLLYQESRISSVKALGLFSIVENLSMGVGPIIFSYIIANNISGGMKILSWVIAGGVVLLIIVSRFSVKWNNEPLDNITQ